MSDRLIRGEADQSRGTPHARSTVTTAERCEIPADMRGRFAWFQSTAGTGAAVDAAVRFGGATVSVALADRDTRTGESLTPAAGTPHLYLGAGALPQRIRLAPDWTHFSHVATGTTGALRFGLSESEGP
jgi:hypothetical protein